MKSFDDYIINYVNQFKTTNQLSANSTSSIGSVSTTTTAASDSFKLINDEPQQNSAHFLNDFELKKQEITFIIEQILTNLLACGVLEFANGFENAINKIFKVFNLFFLIFLLIMN